MRFQRPMTERYPSKFYEYHAQNAIALISKFTPLSTGTNFCPFSVQWQNATPPNFIKCAKCYCNVPIMSWICKLFSASCYTWIISKHLATMKQRTFPQIFKFLLTGYMSLVSFFNFWNHQKTYNEEILAMEHHNFSLSFVKKYEIP